MSMIRFEGKKAGETHAEREISLLAASTSAGVPLNHRCGGHARCGTCLVTVTEGQDKLSPMGAAETRILKILKAQPNQRLACQAWTTGGVTCSYS